MTQMTNMRIVAVFVTLLGVAAMHVSATAQQDPAAALAKKLANPISSLVSIPIQYNHDSDLGADGVGSLTKINVQPVAPFSAGGGWNLITRTIIPILDQSDLPQPGLGESGLGDVVASQFFSPKMPTSGGWIWGAGPVELLPTASDDALGGGKWGVGPTAVALKQVHAWTIGGLANHIWSVAGDDARADVNATFLQPFLSYITKTKTTIGLNLESTYDWEAEAWSVPLNLTVSQLLKVGPQILQVGGGVRYWLDSPDGGPEDWGARVQVTLLFPR